MFITIRPKFHLLVDKIETHILWTQNLVTLGCDLEEDFVTV